MQPGGQQPKMRGRPACRGTNDNQGRKETHP
jgi:hypothetical protein